MIFNAAHDQYRPGTVDMALSSAEGGHSVLAFTQAGEWLSYTMKVNATGTYNLSTRVAAAVSGSQFHFEVDGVNVTGKMTVPNTGDWDRYTTLTHGPILLTAGQHRVRLFIDAAGSHGFAANVSTFEFDPSKASKRVRKPTHHKVKTPKVSAPAPTNLPVQTQTAARYGHAG